LGAPPYYRSCGVIRCHRVVIKVSQGCHRGVLGVKECRRGVVGVSQGCYRGVTGMLLGLHRGGIGVAIGVA